jgi:hypothetical protein
LCRFLQCIAYRDKKVVGDNIAFFAAGCHAFL